jgi:leader peptidase (prepilin peptidase)/N-methyltransferase
MAEVWPWALAQGVLGAVFGSYIATLALRWPEPARGRSRCDACGERLRWWELAPLVSYLMLRGRCARCAKPIAAWHPVVELLGVAIGLVAALVAPGSAGAGGAATGWLLLALGAIDARIYRLPNTLTGALGVVALAQVMILDLPFGTHLAGGILGLASLWLVAAAYRALRGREGLGGGDAKLFGAIGLWLGWRALPWVLLIACAVGLAIALARAMRRDARLPLGALLAPAAFAMWCVQA